MAMDKNKGKGKAAPSKRVTSKNYETGLTSFPSGVTTGKRPAGGFATGPGKIVTSTDRRNGKSGGKITGIAAYNRTNYVAPKKAPKKK